MHLRIRCFVLCLWFDKMVFDLCPYVSFALYFYIISFAYIVIFNLYTVKNISRQ